MTGVAGVAGGSGDTGGAERAEGALRSLEVGRGEPRLSCEQRRDLDVVFAITLVFPTPSTQGTLRARPVGPAEGRAGSPCRLLC